MKDLWNRIWHAEPVRLVGALVIAWSTIVAFDQGNDSWNIPLWIYIVALPVIAFLTEITRGKVTSTPK